MKRKAKLHNYSFDVNMEVCMHVKAKSLKRAKDAINAINEEWNEEGCVHINARVSLAPFPSVFISVGRVADDANIVLWKMDGKELDV